MKKLLYDYSNGIIKVHTKFTKDKTMLKEAKGAKQVNIYKCNDYEIDDHLDGFVTGKYITTLGLN